MKRSSPSVNAARQFEAKCGMEYENINANGQNVRKGRAYLNTISIESLPGGVYSVLCNYNGETRLARFVRL